jgi:hypothetical protein
MSLATLADLMSAGAKTAQAFCACGRIEALDLAALSVTHGPGTIFYDIRARLRCNACGSRGQATTTIDYPFTAGFGQVSNHGVSK